MPIAAQDTTDPAVYAYPVLDLNAVAALLSNSVAGLVLAAFGAAPITVVLVNLLKNLPQFKHVPSSRILVGVAGVLYLGSISASLTDATVQFNSFLEFLTTAAPALLSFIGTLFAAPALYDAARDRHIPLVGMEKKTDPLDPRTGYEV